MFDIDYVRRMAALHGFVEIQFNEASRVISFEKEAGPRCRVNVYYTTGTVATCLDHPRSGKTQLFRRGQSIDDLDTILKNPRHHTGVGYYRSKDKEDWKPVDNQGRHRNFQKAECDDARRWRYIQSTQEGFCNESQANQIAALCKLWHQLRFAPPGGTDIITTAEAIKSMDPAELDVINQRLIQAGFSPISVCEDCEESGCRCNERAGSYCSILNVILKVARDTDNVQGLAYMKEGESSHIQSVDELMDCQCHDGKIFQQRYSTFLDKLERQFRSFPPKIRRELLHWFISKHRHGYEPFMINPDYDPSMDCVGKNCPVDFYGSTFCSNEILRAHHDYGEMAYNEGAKGCNCHGI